MTTKPEFDVRSAEPVLFYKGPGTLVSAPAADLSANTLVRIAWIRAGSERPLSPDDVKPAAIARIRDELLATGFYSNKPVKEPTDV